MHVRVCSPKIDDGTSAMLRALELCLLDDPMILDCVALQRVDGDEAAVIAYVVSRAPIASGSLIRRARAGGCAVVPSQVVRVSAIPLTDDGRVDEDALMTIPTGGAPSADVPAGAPHAAAAPMAIAPAAGTAAGRGDPRPASAHSAGEPIVWSGDRPRAVTDLLVRAAARDPHQTVTCVEVDGDHVMTYADLLAQARRITSGLRAAGLQPGDRVILQFDRNVDFVPAFWGCVLGGFVPAPLAVPLSPDPSSGAATKLRNAWHLLGRPRLLTTDALYPSLADLGHALELPAVDLLTIEHVRQSPPDPRDHPAAPGDLALLLLTSGSTGVPKAVMQTHAALLAACAAMAQRNDFSSRDVPLNWISLDHVGGIVMCHLMFVALGARQVHVRGEYILQDPLRWLDLIERHRATFTWAPNFAFALINDRADDLSARRRDLSSMRFVLNGGEAVVPRTARRFLRLLGPHGLPATAMRPAWGMSETSSAATFADPLLLDATRDEDDLVEVGRPDPGFEMRIVDDHGTVVPEGRTGRLEVRGPNVTCGYFNNADATAEAFTADGWFRTGDLGRLMGGRLTITGREKGVIIVNGVNYYAHEVEAAAEDVPGVVPSFTAAFAIREPGAATDTLAVAFHAAVDGDAALGDVIRRARAAVLERVGIAPGYLLPVAMHEIPKTEIGKIQRPALTTRFESGGFAEALARVARVTSRAEAMPDWFFHAVWRQRRPVCHQPLGAGATVVVIADAAPFTSSIERRVRAAGAQCVVCGPETLPAALAGVPASDRLVVLAGNEFARPARAEDLGDEASRAIGRAVSLVQAIAASPRGAAPCELIVFDDRVQHVRPGDRVAPSKAAAIGVLRTAAAEYPHLAVRHVDLGASDPEGIAARLEAEIEDRIDEPQVAYRDGERWVRRLDRRALDPHERGHRFETANGFYLVTGGSGGVGLAVCRHVQRTANVPLLIVGRTPLDGMTHDQRAAVADLQTRGDVVVQAADVEDPAALGRAVAMASDAFGRPLAGVLHLAGAFAPRPLAEETPATLAQAIGAKVRGAWNIHRLLQAHPDAAFIAFSSVNGCLGGYAAGAYAAANAFLDALVEHQVRDLRRPAWSLGWSMWDGVGMSRTFALREAAERRGYRAIAPAQGLASLLACVGGEPGHVLIGLDAGHADIERHLSGSTPVVSRAARPPAPGAAADPSLESDLERSIAAIWRGILPSGDISPNDNFFDAGGTSVLVAQAGRALQQLLGRDVPVTDIYRFPTLRLLAAHYGGTDHADAVGLDDSEERGQARRARRLQRSRRGR